MKALYVAAKSKELKHEKKGLQSEMCPPDQFALAFHARENKGFDREVASGFQPVAPSRSIDRTQSLIAYDRLSTIAALVDKNDRTQSLIASDLKIGDNQSDIKRKAKQDPSKLRREKKILIGYELISVPLPYSVPPVEGTAKSNVHNHLLRTIPERKFIWASQYENYKRSRMEIINQLSYKSVFPDIRKVYEEMKRVVRLVHGTEPYNDETLNRRNI